MGPNCWNFLGNSLSSRGCPELRGCLGLFNSGIFELNHVFIGKRSGMGRTIGPKTWDRIVEFLDHEGSP